MASYLEHLEALRGDQRTLGDYGAIVYRRRYLILLVALVAGGTAWYVSGRLTPRYEAATEFYIPEDVAGPVLGPEQGKTRLPSGEREHAKSYVTVLKGLEARKVLHERFPQKTTKELNDDVDISVNRQGIVQLYVRDTDPALAAEIANGFVEYFNEFNDRIVSEQIDRTRASVEQSLEQAKLKRRELEDARRAFREQNNVAAVLTRIEQLELRLQTHRENRRLALIDRQTLEEQIYGVQEQLAVEESAFLTGDSLLTSAALEGLRAQLVATEVELAAKRVEFKPDHPDIVILERRREETRRAIADESTRLVSSRSKPTGSLYESMRAQLASLMVDRVASAARAEALEVVIGQLETELATLPALATEAERYELDIGAQQAIVLGLQEQRNFLDRQTLQRRPATIVLQRAEPPAKPIFPLPVLNSIVAGLAGLVAGILLALFIDYLETRRYLQRLRYLEEQDWARTLMAELEGTRSGDPAV